MPKPKQVRKRGFPTSVPSLLGRVFVEQVEVCETRDGTRCMGIFDPTQRTIYIKSTLPIEQRWQTLRHEQVEALLFDTGWERRLRHKDKEGLCDVIALGVELGLFDC